jgi:hypothetical protein
MNFNLPHINTLLDSFEVLRDRKFESHNVSNMDKTSVRTVKAPNRNIGPKEKNLVGFITSSEYGTLITVRVSQ